MASEIWHKIKELDPKLSKSNKVSIKLAATTVLKLRIPEDKSSVIEIYGYMTDAYEKKAPFYLHKMLQVVHSKMAEELAEVMDTNLDQTEDEAIVKEGEDIIELLEKEKKVAEMSDDNYKKFRKWVAEELWKEDPTNIESQYYLVKRLYDNKELYANDVQEKLDECSINDKGRDQDGRSGWYYRFLCILALAIIVIIIVLITIVSVKATSHMSYFKPKEYSATTGSNTTVLLKEKCFTECTDDLESVVITRGPIKADTTIYLADEILLSTPVTLPPKKPRQYPLEGKSKIGINYYLNYPIHTAGPGIITYTINTTITDDDNTTECPLEFYLFNSNYTYREFLRNTSRPDYIDCFSPCNETNTSFESIQTFSFKCPRSGFYFVGVSLENGVSVDATISAELKAFQHPPNNFSKCHLSPTDKESCTFPVNSPYSKVCLYAVSKDTFIQNVTIAFNCKYVERSQFSSYWVMVVLIILFVIVLFCVCACALIKRRREKKLESNKTEKTPLIEKN